jgi:hypothetical protein
VTTTTGSRQSWAAKPRPAGESESGENKWPAWRVTLGVIVFCTAAWIGIGYLAIRLLG